MKLYKVTVWNNGSYRTDTFENFVVAENEDEAREIVEEEVWSLTDMGIESIEEIDMSSPQLLCFVNPNDM